MKGMMMIGMMADMETEMKSGMDTGERENGVLEIMTDMVGMGTHMAVMGTGTAEMMTALAEMATGMMIIVEEVEVLMIINMAPGAEALTEIVTALMKKMVNSLPGLSTLGFVSYANITSDLFF